MNEVSTSELYRLIQYLKSLNWEEKESEYTPSLAGLCSFKVSQPRKQLQNKQKYPRKLSRSLGYNYKTIHKKKSL